MKNLVLVDFTNESIEALNYAIDFTKQIDGDLEIVNVSDEKNKDTAMAELLKLKTQFSTPDFEIKVNELIGEMEEKIPEFVNGDKIGFVFCGTHKMKLMEQFFSSRILNLMNKVKANFIFVPDNLKKYSPIQKVVLPVFADDHSLQNIEALRFLNHFMKFEVELITYKSSDEDVKHNLLIASKLLERSGLKFKIESLGDSETTLRKGLVDLAKIVKADLISIVNLTETNIFNFGEKGFVEGLIRNEQGLPVLVIQNQNTTNYSGFHTTGGY